MIMHPLVPELEGESLVDYSDPEGLYLFVEMVDVVEELAKTFNQASSQQQELISQFKI